MNRREFFKAAATATAAAAICKPAIAQAAWPAKGRTIKIIVPWPPGAANDALGRLVAQRLQEKFGIAAIVCPHHPAVCSQRQMLIYIVGRSVESCEYCFWDDKVERLSGLGIDDEIEFGGFSKGISPGFELSRYRLPSVPEEERRRLFGVQAHRIYRTGHESGVPTSTHTRSRHF